MQIISQWNVNIFLDKKCKIKSVKVNTAVLKDNFTQNVMCADNINST